MNSYARLEDIPAEEIVFDSISEASKRSLSRNVGLLVSCIFSQESCSGDVSISPCFSCLGVFGLCMNESLVPNAMSKFWKLAISFCGCIVIQYSRGKYPCTNLGCSLLFLSSLLTIALSFGPLGLMITF